MLDREFKMQRAQTARDLAAIAYDPFTKKRLLDLAARYEDDRLPTPVNPGVWTHRIARSGKCVVRVHGSESLPVKC